MQRHEMIQALGDLGLKGMAGTFDEAVTTGLQRGRTECPSAATWWQVITVAAPMDAHEDFRVAREAVLARHAALDELARMVDEELAAVGALLEELDIRGRR